MLDEVENTNQVLDVQTENEVAIQITHIKEEINEFSKKSSLEDRISEKISSKETKSHVSDKKEDPSSDSESEESVKKSEKSSASGESENNQENPENLVDYKNLKGLNSKNEVKNKENQSNFYEKKVSEKKVKEKKLELHRKKIEDEARNRTKPQINAESKKIMDKKQGFVKPIYQRAKEIEETKKNKIDSLKRTQEEKNAKKEEEVFKSKILSNNKQFDEKVFLNWRNKTLEWETKLKQKIHNQKDDLLKQEVEKHSKYYRPNIDKKSENIHKSKNENENISVHDKLYNMKDDKQNKLMQKIVDSFPEFKPKINKKYPNYFQKNKENNNNVNQVTNEKTPSKTTKKAKFNSIDISTKLDVTNNYNTVNICFPKSERQKGKNASLINYDVVNSLTIDSEEENEEINECDDIIKQYKLALEMTEDVRKNETINNFNTNDKNNYDNRNTEKINKYSQKLAGIANNIKIT